MKKQKKTIRSFWLKMKDKLLEKYLTEIWRNAPDWIYTHPTKKPNKPFKEKI